MITQINNYFVGNKISYLLSSSPPHTIFDFPVFRERWNNFSHIHNNKIVVFEKILSILTDSCVGYDPIETRVFA